VPEDPPRRIFRPSPPTRVIGWVIVAVFALPGPIFVGGGLADRAVGADLFGVFLLLLAAFSIRGIATSVLIATPAGLVYWDWMRRRSVEWSEIRHFDVGLGRSRGGWPAVIITLRTGPLIRTEVAAYGHGYLDPIVDELTALQRQYAPPPPRPAGSDLSAARKRGGVGALSLAAGLALAGIRIAQVARSRRLG
jgi:hypothetical protein